jgi:hypothetical protein
MIEIIRETIQNEKQIQYVITSLNGETCYQENFTVERFTQKATVPGNLYDRGVTGCVKKINEQFDRELNWLIIKKLTELPTAARIMVDIPLDEFDTHSIVSLLLKYYPSGRRESLRIICSPSNFRVLEKAVMSDTSMYGSFAFSKTVLEVKVEVEDIPENEIWIIDLESWRAPISVPSNSVNYEPRSKSYIYTRSYRMGRPICVGEKLIRVRLQTEDPMERTMQELLDKMRLPLRKTDKPPIPLGKSVWLTGNPDEGIRVTNNVPTVTVSLKETPQMFNPSMPVDLKTKKKK